MLKLLKMKAILKTNVGGCLVLQQIKQLEAQVEDEYQEKSIAVKVSRISMKASVCLSVCVPGYACFQIICPSFFSSLYEAICLCRTQSVYPSLYQIICPSFCARAFVCVSGVL